jgi:hypothetical protein
LKKKRGGRKEKGESKENRTRSKGNRGRRKEEELVFVITIEVRISSRHQVVMLNVGVA